MITFKEYCDWYNKQFKDNPYRRDISNEVGLIEYFKLKDFLFGYSRPMIKINNKENAVQTPYAYYDGSDSDLYHQPSNKRYKNVSGMIGEFVKCVEDGGGPSDIRNIGVVVRIGQAGYYIAYRRIDIEETRILNSRIPSGSTGDVLDLLDV